MSDRYRWKAAFELGIPELDAEHHAFFDLANEVREGVERGDPEAVRGALGDLRRYAEVHFAHEEAFLERAGCPELAVQRTEHAAFAGGLAALDGAALPQEAADFARTWLVDHILGSDQRCAAWLREHGPAGVPYPAA